MMTQFIDAYASITTKMVFKFDLNIRLNIRARYHDYSSSANVLISLTSHEFNDYKTLINSHGS